MPRVAVDFSDVQDFEAFEDGEYEGIIEKVTYRESQQEGKYPYLNVQYKITEDGPAKDRNVWEVWSFSPKALFRMKQALENLGVINPDDEIEIDYDEDTEIVTEPELSGIPVLLSISQRVYEGRTQNQVDHVAALDGALKKGTKTNTARATGTSKTASKTKTAASKSKTAGRKFR